MLALEIFLLVVGFALLVKGADWFVDGSAGIAAKCRVSPLVIGLTIVAFGTSAPELCVSITSAVQKSTDIAIGNVVGSNIVNILLILGVSALLHNLPVQKNSLRLDLPVLIVASILLVVLGIWGEALQWWDGLILLVILSAYMAVLLVNARKEQKALKEAAPEEEQPSDEDVPKGKIGQWFAQMRQKTWFLVLLVLVGLGMVVGGGTLLVNSAKYIARYFGVSERIIGLTVVAIGTSLPELVTSVVAAAKGETDIAVGNIIGSNIFNIFIVAGISSLFHPLAFSVGANLIDALVALGAAVLLFVCALPKGHRIGKIAGALMLVCFIGYYTYLFLV